MSIFWQNTKAKFVRVDLQQKGKGISFKDVAGLHEAKVEIMEFVDYLRTPEKYMVSLGSSWERITGVPNTERDALDRPVNYLESSRNEWVWYIQFILYIHHNSNSS